MRPRTCLLLWIGALGVGCGEAPPQVPTAAPAAASPVAQASAPEPEPREELPPLSPSVARALQPWTGDLPGMRKRRLIRVLVTYDKTNFFFAEGRARGFEYDLLHRFEKALNADLAPGDLPTRVVFLPVPFERLLPALVEGRGDIAAAGLTITPEREERVSFTAPYLTGVDEVVVTAAGVRGLESLDDLAGRRVVVPRGTSYASHLRALSGDLVRRGLPAIEVLEADEKLQSEDLLELLNAGALDLTVVDRHVAELWSGAFPEIAVRGDLALHRGSRIAWAVRRESPRLREALDAFARANRKGTLIGNLLFRRYHEADPWIENPLSRRDSRRLADLQDLFRRYAELYDFDWLSIAALAYQESAFDQSKRSERGAIGIMQILPSTAADPNVAIPDVSELEPNVHAGVRYLAFLRDRYFSSDEIDEAERFDFAVAAYNAGPRRVARLRERAAALGLDANRWFGNVEVAALELLGRETVRTVARVNKYFLAYRLAQRSRPQRLARLD